MRPHIQCYVVVCPFHIYNHSLGEYGMMINGPIATIICALTATRGNFVLQLATQRWREPLRDKVRMTPSFRHLSRSEKLRCKLQKKLSTFRNVARQMQVGSV